MLLGWQAWKSMVIVWLLRSAKSSFESAGLLNVVTATVAANFQIAHVVLQCFTLSGSLLGKVCEFYGSALNLTIPQRILHSVISSVGIGCFRPKRFLRKCLGTGARPESMAQGSKRSVVWRLDGWIQDVPNLLLKFSFSKWLYRFVLACRMPVRGSKHRIPWRSLFLLWTPWKDGFILEGLRSDFDLEAHGATWINSHPWPQAASRYQMDSNGAYEFCNMKYHEIMCSLVKLIVLMCLVFPWLARLSLNMMQLLRY